MDPARNAYVRVFKQGGRRDVAPLPTSFAYRPLDRDRLRLLPPGQYGTIGRSCPIHDACSGHLSLLSTGHVLVPAHCMVDEPDATDRRGTLTESAIQGRCDIAGYGTGIRETLMGKRGLLRYKVAGCRPIASARGVATVTWQASPEVLFMPRAWMSKIRYLAPEQDKDSDDDGDNDGCLSSRLAETGPETGSWAIVLRCPALGEDSAQAVRLVPWDNWSIGVHPELCAPLHLDFDGDEVHVFMTSDTASMAEIRARASRARYSKFTEPVVRAAMDWCDDIAPEDVVHGTFIRSSTMTLESLLNDPVPHPVHRLGRCKVELWPVLKDRYLAEDKPIRFVEQCSLAMSNVIASQLSVSDGYMVTRQSKYLGSQLVSTRTGLHMPCWYGPGSEAIEAIDSDVVPTGTHHGSPAMRVLARLSAKAMQGSLDKAKHRSTQAMSVSPASSLITGQDRALCIVNDPVAGHLMRVLRSDAAGDVLARVIATSSVKIVSEAIARGMTLNKTWSLCLSSAVMILHEEQIQGDEHETVALAAVIMALARSGVDSPMALPGRSRVLSELGCNWLVCCLNEDLSAIRRLRTAGAETFADAHPIADPATAFVFGNFSACACVQCTISAIGKAIVNVSVDPARLQNVIVPVPVSNQSVDAIDVQIEAYLPMTWHLSLCLFSLQSPAPVDGGSSICNRALHSTARLARSSDNVIDDVASQRIGLVRIDSLTDALSQFQEQEESDAWDPSRVLLDLLLLYEDLGNEAQSNTATSAILAIASDASREAVNDFLMAVEQDEGNGVARDGLPGNIGPAVAQLLALWGIVV
ncbi:unnamed protein product [Closterium sp. NIES-64]|nr:unnamed protein product [Closterium sp. NIES-64]